MLKQRILGDKTQALKDRNAEKRLVLSTLLGELDNSGKNPVDAKVISVIRKMIENNKITNTEHENVYLEPYLPVSLSDEDLENYIRSFIYGITQVMETKGEKPSMRNMKEVMNFLSLNFAGQYDGKQASKIAKKLLM